MPTVRKQGVIKPQGFSMVELLVVVMVILIIAAIAIPGLVHAKMRANEAAAVASMKTIQVAEAMYANNYPDVGFAGSLPNLGTHGSTCEKPTSTNACIIMDDALTSGLKSGYIFELTSDGKRPAQGYTINATPESSASGSCSISSNERGGLHISVLSGSGDAGTRSVSSSSGGGCDL